VWRSGYGALLFFFMVYDGGRELVVGGDPLSVVK
jgi:hypothetical protein